VRWGLVFLPLYGLLTFFATLTHQPDYNKDFQAYAEYITTTQFLIGHLVGSILGNTLFIFGLLALFTVVYRPRPGLALVALALSIAGVCLILPIFGLAAFAQPAIGDAFLEGNTSVVEIHDQIYGTAALAIGVTGTLLYSIGGILFGMAIWRSGLPKWSGLLYGAATPLISFVGLAIGPAQTLGSLLLIAAGIWIALTVWREGMPGDSDQPASV
jgi:hypothetical protein